MRLRAASFALVLAFVAARWSTAGQAAVPDRPAGSNVPQLLFATSLPLAEIAEGGWSDAQRRTVEGIVERIRTDDRIHVVVRVVTDPIGSRDENARWGRAVAEAVAARLVASGVPAARISAEDGDEAGDLRGGVPWTGLERLQAVVVNLLRAPLPPAPGKDSPRGRR